MLKLVDYDMVINDGKIIDVIKKKILKANIGIVRDKIACISEEKLTGKRVIEARGKIVSPGFIDFHSHVDAKVFSATCIAKQGGTTTIGGERSFDGKAIRKIEEDGFLINHGFYISHSFTLRTAAGIKDPYRPATRREIKDMVNLACKFFENGAFGIHFGLEFVPGTSEEEIIKLSEVAKNYEKVVLVHLRKDGRESLKYFNEIIQAARITGASIHMFHLMYMIGYKGVVDKAIGILENAISDGIDITADTGLYSAFPCCIGSSILDEGWEKGYVNVNVKDLLISSGIYAGKRCTNEMFKFLREEFPYTLVTAFVCDNDAIEKLLKKEYIFVSTNAADGPHYENIGHPETAGTFPRLIHQYVKKKETIDIIEAIRKITILPATRFKIKNKGLLSEGADADITIFDYEKIKDNANYIGRGNPNEPPVGIEHVIVNGKVIFENNDIDITLKPGKRLKAV